MYERLSRRVVRERVLAKMGDIINSIPDVDQLDPETPIFITDKGTGHVFLSLLNCVIPIGDQTRRNVLPILGGGLISFPPNKENSPAELVDCVLQGVPPASAIICDGQFLKALTEASDSKTLIKWHPGYYWVQRPYGKVDVYATQPTFSINSEIP